MKCKRRRNKVVKLRILISFYMLSSSIYIHKLGIIDHINCSQLNELINLMLEMAVSLRQHD